MQSLQNEVTARQDGIKSLPKLVRLLQPFLNPMGASDVAQQQANTTASWDVIHAKAADRTSQLNSALSERQTFMGNWESLETLMDKAHRKLDGTSEVYSDEVKDTLTRVKVH